MTTASLAAAATQTALGREQLAQAPAKPISDADRPGPGAATQTDTPSSPAAAPAEKADTTSLAERAAALFLDSEEDVVEASSDPVTPSVHASATPTTSPAGTSKAPTRFAKPHPLPGQMKRPQSPAAAARTSMPGGEKPSTPSDKTHRGAVPVANVEKTPLPPIGADDVERAARLAPAAGPAQRPTGERTAAASIGTPTPLVESDSKPAAALEPSQTRILFDGQSAVLSDEAQDELTELAKRVSQAGKAKITILGYADGGQQDNAAGQARIVSLSRVLAVRQFLMVRGLSGELLIGRAMGRQTAESPSDRVDVLISQL